MAYEITKRAQAFPLPKAPKHKKLKGRDRVNGQRQPRSRDERHLRVIRKLPSIITGSQFEVEAAHIRYADSRFDGLPTGMQRKPDDWRVLPLTRGEHQFHKDAQHKGNEQAFWCRYNIDALVVAEALYRVWDLTKNESEALAMMLAIIPIATRLKGPAR